MRRVPIVLFGDHIAAYGVVRALGPSGIPIYVVSAKGNGITTKSRYIRGVFTLPSDADDFCGRLIQWGAKNVGSDAVLIVAGTDDYLDILSQHYGDLPEGWRPTFPPWDIVMKVRKKRETYAIAERIGLPIPKFIHIETKKDFDRFTSKDISMRWPLLIKPERSSEFLKNYGSKGFVCETIAELKIRYDKYSTFDGGFLIQEFIPGPESNLLNFIGIYNSNSEPVSIFFNRKVRSSGPLLSCTLMETDWSETAIEYSNKLIKAIGYRGYANVEFKLDPLDQAIKLMEINGRVSKSNSHALLCNINLPLTMYNDATGAHLEPLIEFQCPYEKNIHWWYPLGDLGAIRLLRGNGEASWMDILKSLRGNKRIIEPFSLKDPYPGLSQIFSLASSVIRKVSKGILSPK